MPETPVQVAPGPRLGAPQGAASVHLDALRGIAAIGVCLSHVRDIFFRYYSQLAHHSPLLALVYVATGVGHQWVIVFFVLSGYLVGGSVLRAHARGRWNWNGYLFNRFTRLYVVLLPALILGMLLDIAGLHFFGANGIYGGHTGTISVTFAVKSRLGLAALLGNCVFLQKIFVEPLGSNGPLWSLTNEFWYYIAFPALFFAVVPRVKWPRRIFHFALLVAVIVMMKHEIALLGLVWLMGVALHYLPPIRIEKAAIRGVLMAAAIGVFAAVLAWCRYNKSSWTDYPLGVVVTVLFYILLCCSRGTLPNLYTRAARSLSRSSYTLYLAHFPLLIFIAAFLETEFHRSRWLPDAPHVLMGFGLFLVAMIYAQVVWFVFEKRTDELRMWLRSVFRPAARRAVTDPGSPQ